MRIAIVHDWLTWMRGGERVLEQLIALCPQAEVFTLLHIPGSVSPAIEQRPIHTSWIGALPGARRGYRFYLPLFPYAIQAFNLDRFDLVLSSSSCAAKGVRVPAAVPHICYCHTPMRYLYDQSDAYARRLSWIARAGYKATRAALQRWDQQTARNVTHFIANSNHVRERIASLYGRAATVVHPPVDVDRFEASKVREDFYVSLAALVPYKRVDLVVRAFNALGKRLIVIGSGPELSHLRRLAKSNIEFRGWLLDAEVTSLLSRCRGLVYAGVEDFGIALVEAQAAGAPVIARAAGGALETVIASTNGDATGVLFREPTTEAIVEAVLEAERRRFDPAALRLNAGRFHPDNFRAVMRAEVDSVLAGRQLIEV